MPARPPRRPLRGRLRADFGSDAGVSEVLGNVLLIAMTVGLLGGFGALVLTTVSNETPAPPAASFTLEPALGSDEVQVRLVSGATLELDGTTLVLLVNDLSISEATDVDGDAAATSWSPGQTLFVELSRALAADDELLFIAADNASGKSIGTAYATVSGAFQGSILVDSALTPTLSFSPTTLVTDGATSVVASVSVDASLGLLLIDHVVLDLSPVGGPVELRLLDDGLGEDALASDGHFTTSFSVSGFDYDMLPGIEVVPLDAVVYDVLGRATTATASLTLVEPTPSKAGAGVVFRDIGASVEIGTTGYIDLAQFVLREDGSLIEHDEVELRVSDLDDATKVWTALVRFGYDTAACPGMAIVTSIELTVAGAGGSALYTPATGDCFEVTETSVLNLANIHGSETSSTVAWDVTGDEDAHTYEAAGIGASNEALISFFGDTLTLSPAARGLEQTDFAWGPGTVTTVPAAITTLTATKGNGLVDLAWAAPADGGSAITAYNVYQDGVLVATVPAPATSYQVSGLTNGVSYTFRVRAVNAVGEAATSNAAVATPSTTPAAPVVTPTAGDAQVQLSWTTPANGGSAITAYHVYASSTSGSTAWVASVTAPTTTYTVTGLSNGVAYFFNVTAANANGQGTSSAEVSATPAAAATAPAAPASLDATAGLVQVQLDWAAPSDGGSPITGYVIYRGTSSGSLSPLATIGTNTSFLDANVVAGTTYHYAVRAVNAIGTSAASNEDSATPSAVPTAPAAPTDLAATGGTQQVALSWSPPSNGGSPITGYVIYRGTLSGSLSPLATIGTNTSFADLAVTGGTTYYYEVRAVNVIGTSAASDQASALPIAPSGAPQALAATRGNTSAALSWSAPATNGGSAVTGYVVYTGTTSSTSAIAAIGTNTSFTVNGLTNGVLYHFHVAAVNAAGTSAKSSGATATPASIPWPPGTPGASASVGQVALSWSAAPNDGGSAVTGYQIWRGTSSGALSQLATLGTNLSFMDLAVSAGTTYHYHVVAVNALGASNPSVEASATLPSAPGAPLALAATRANTSVALSWSAPSSTGGSAITNYVVYVGTSASTTQLATTGGTNTSFTVNGLTNGQLYYFHVAAVNAVGTSAKSTQATATPASIPWPPATFTATAGSGQVGLVWTAPANDGGSAVTGYQIWRGTSSGSLSQLATLGTNLSFTDLAVSGGTTYYYHVRAVNALGAGNPSVERSALPSVAASVPGAPLDLTLTPANQRVAVTWTAPTSDGGSPLTGYRIYRSLTNSTASMTLVTTIGTNTSYVDMGLTNGTTYYYHVRAVNAVGDGALTSIKHAIPSGPIPVNCGSAATGSGTFVAGSCTTIQTKDGISAELEETQAGASGNTKQLSMTFSLNATGITGTQSLQLVGRTGNSAENLLVQVLDPSTSTYTTMLTLSSATTVTLSANLAASTYWPSGTLTIRLLDSGPDGGFSSWHLDYVGLVTT